MYDANSVLTELFRLLDSKKQLYDDIKKITLEQKKILRKMLQTK